MAGRATGVRTGVGAAFVHGPPALVAVQIVQARVAAGSNFTAFAVTLVPATTTPPDDVVDTTTSCVVGLSVLFCWMAMRTVVVSDGSDPVVVVDAAGSSGTPADWGPAAAASGGSASAPMHAAAPASSAARGARGRAEWRE